MNNIEWIKQQTLTCYQAIKEGYAEPIEMYNKVVELNFRLVYTVLAKYKPYTEDQFQIGCMGLLSASRTYKLESNVPFASYACFCIERAIQQDYLQRAKQFEAQVDSNQWIYLDAMTKDVDGDGVRNDEVIYDEKAEQELYQFIEDNELDFMVNQLIKPVIEDAAKKSSVAKSKINLDKWKQLELAYILDIAMEDSQKKRMTLSQLAKGSNVSIQNVKTRHAKIMDEIFQRMWNYMTLSFSELLEHIRGKNKIPHKLICFDPGKTTGWCTFVDGKLDKYGQLTECYDNNNINVSEVMNLLQEEKPDFILYEDYKVYSHKLERHTFNPIFTLRLIGAIETYIQMNNIPSHKQMAVTAKNFCTDEKLKQWGFWKTGMRHSRDAIRHGCYFLLFYKKGGNIIE